MGIQTLHSHTTQSDGRHSHLEVLDICNKYNISTIAFTDHDSLMSEKTFKELKNSNTNIKWISGIEISSGLPKELGGNIVSDFHIVGLFVDTSNKDLQQHCKLALEARIKRMQKMVKNLQSLGFNITEEDCLKASGGEAVGRPHIVTALEFHEENKEVYKKLIEKMRLESESNEEVKKQYDAMINRGEYQYPYVLFLSNDSYIPGIYVDYEYAVDMDKSVSLIRNAGGVAIVAHYFTVLKRINTELMSHLLRDNRLDGMETVFGLFAYGTNAEAEIKEIRETTKKLTLENSAIQSGGADAHTEEDFKLFSEANWYSEETIGMAERILAMSKAEMEYSNLDI